MQCKNFAKKHFKFNLLKSDIPNNSNTHALQIKLIGELAMSKLNIIASVILIIFLLVSACFPLVFSAEGFIRINTRTNSPLNQQIQAGGSVNLFFGEVTWSGTQMYLLLSRDNAEQISTGDIIYTPKFALSDLINPSARVTYSNDNGAWIVGANWINGTIPQNVPIGNYYIKAFDEAAAKVAVTDTSLIVYSVVYSATLQSTPPSGAGGITADFTGSGYPPMSPVTISYYDPAFGSWNYLTTTKADATGKISFNTQVPDLRKSAGAGDQQESFSQVSYRAEINGIVYCYYDYNQYARGLKRVGAQTANGLYGNGTNLSSTVNVKVGDSLVLSGKYFHPGVVYIRWDGSNIVGTVTASQWQNAAIIGTTVANSAGAFDTSVTIPAASAGEHYLSVEDTQTKVIIKIHVSLATLDISPSSGPGGATVQFTGSGYPESTPITISYLDPKFNTWNALTTVTSDASGTIQTTIEMPDLRQSLRNYDTTETSTAISFRAEHQDTIYGYANYNEYHRGLIKIGTQIANGLYGNGTSLTSTVKVEAGDSLTITGKYFHPGVIYVRWDGYAISGTVTSDQWSNAIIIGTATANGEGYFEATATIPSASPGEHYISVEDSQTKVIFKVTLIQNATIPSPTPPVNPKANATISLSCQSTTSYIGYKVEINGRLTSNTEPIPAAAVSILYSINGSNTWQSLTLAYTDSNGEFAAVWMPQVSGNYLIKATWEGNTEFNQASKTISFASAPYAQQNVFSVISNSTVTELAFNSTSNQLSFSVTGPSRTTGFVDVGIAKNIVPDITNLQIYLDNTKLTYTTTSTPDTWFIHLQYNHSTHKVIINLGQTIVPTPTPLLVPTSTPTSTPAPTSTIATVTQTETPMQTQEPTPAASAAPTPSPTVPEFPAAALLTIAIAALTIIFTTVRKARRIQNQE